MMEIRENIFSFSIINDIIPISIVGIAGVLGYVFV